MASTDATTSSPAPSPDKRVKPEKPDEEKYKEDLAKAEKEHAALMDQMVGFGFLPDNCMIRRLPTVRYVNIRHACSLPVDPYSVLIECG